MKKTICIFFIVIAAFSCLLLASCEKTEADSQNNNSITTDSSYTNVSSHTDVSSQTEISFIGGPPPSTDESKDAPIPSPIDGDDYEIMYSYDLEDCYFVFHDIRTYKKIQVGLDTVRFPDIKEFVDTVTNGQLNRNQKAMISKWESDEIGIKICDLKNLYHPTGLPDNMEVTTFGWQMTRYYFVLEGENASGFFSIYGKELMDKKYEEDYKNAPYKTYPTVETKTIAGTDIEGQHYYESDGRLAELKYELVSQDKTIYILKRFSKSAGQTQSSIKITMFVYEGETCYNVQLECANDIADSELLKFSVSPYNAE